MKHGWKHLRPEDRETILEGIQAGRALGGPYHVELDPIDVCNADCFFCNSVEFRMGDILRWDALEPILDQLVEGGLRSFRFAGGGEPLIYPDIHQLSDYMSKAGVALENVTTNGIKLDDERLGALLPLGPTDYHVSINYVSPEQYARFMRTPANRFDWVVEGIERLDRRLLEAGQRKGANIHLQFFVHRSTIDDIPAMIELGEKLPCDSVSLRSVGDCEETELLTEADYEPLKAKLEEAVELARDRIWLIMTLGHMGLDEYCQQLMDKLYGEEDAATSSNGAAESDADAALQQAIEYCYIGWYSMTIQGTGAVHPCCFLMPDKEIPEFGNLREQSVQGVWHGAWYERFRWEMRQVMLYETQLPFQHRRFKCTQPFCWKNSSCPLANDMADVAFYDAAHERLERVRRRPGQTALNLGNHALRQLIDSTRSLVKH
jgi:MoaA/NifB/PqqE/SkfB family radical SAM enzyme